MSCSSYEKLFAKKEYHTLIKHFVELINNKFYGTVKAGRPLKLQVENIIKGIFYVLITGCQWYMMPKEYGNGSSIYKHYLKYVKCDIFDELWTKKIFEYIDKCKYRRNLINLSIDCTLIKSINGCDLTGRNPCDRGRKGTKISIITDSIGVPLGMAAGGANKADQKMVIETINNLKIRRKTISNMYADKGYSNKTVKKEMENNRFRLKCENKKNSKIKLFKEEINCVNHVRYVIEATFAWIKKYRRLILRYDRLATSYLSFLKLSFAIIIQRKL